jgi:hypothetical protein
MPGVPRAGKYEAARGTGSRGGEQRSRGVGRHVIEVDFLDEPNGQLVIGEPDVLGGVDARSGVRTWVRT